MEVWYPLASLAAAAILSTWYVGAIWTKKGKRLALPFRFAKYPSWCRFEYPHRVLYYCRHESDAVPAHYNSAADDVSVQDAVAGVFRAKGRDVYYARAQIAAWCRMVQNSQKYLIFRRFPRMAGGWAQIHHSCAALPEEVMAKSTEDSICVVGLESYLLGSSVVRSTCTHELVHVAQQLDRNLLYREWHKKARFSEGLYAEWEALLFAKQLPWAGWVIFRTPLFVFAAVWFCGLMH